MLVCLCACVLVCLCARVLVCLCACVLVCVCVNYVRMFVAAFVGGAHTYVKERERMCVQERECVCGMYVCMVVCMYVWTYV